MVRLLLLFFVGYATAQCTALTPGFGATVGTCTGGTAPCSSTCITPGYSLLGNPITYTCPGSGNYVPDAGVGSCVADCGAHPWVGVNRTTGTCSGVSSPSGTNCTLNCIPGDGITGSNNVTCTNGTWSDPVGTCAACSMNMFSAGDTACQNCPANSGTQSTGSAICACTPGNSFTGPADNCSACAGGTYQSMWGQGSCTSCGGNNWMSAPGSNASTACWCPAGSDNTTNCLACSPTYYNPSNNSACMACGTTVLSLALYNTSDQTRCYCDFGGGSYTGSPFPCTACPVNSYQSYSGMFPNPTCTSCPAGFTTAGQTGQSCCVGFYQTSPGGCMQCTNISKCMQEFCTTGLDQSCTQCNPGYIGYNQPACTACTAGTYRFSYTDATCTSCGFPPATSAPASDGLSSCYCPSPNGKTTFGNSISCAPCQQTTFLNATTGVCDICDNGGSTTVNSPASSTDPSNCTCNNRFGKISPTATPPNLCQACSSTQFTSVVTNMCTACPAGLTVNNNGDGCNCNLPLVWNTGSLACEVPVYYYTLSDWGLCNGQCGMGTVLNNGFEMRTATCWLKNTGIPDTMVLTGYCQGAQIPLPSTQRACTQTCPPAPTGVKATPYYQSVVVNYTMPSQLYVVLLDTCNSTSPCTQGLCDSASGTCRAAYDGFLAESTDGVYSSYKTLATMDGIPGILVPNIPNGVSVSFTVRAITVAITQLDVAGNSAIRPLRSEKSSASGSVTPQGNLGCAVNCNHGICKAGSCVCDPGYIGAVCDGTATILVNSQAALAIDIVSYFTISYSLTPSVDLYSGNNNYVDIYLYDAACKNLQFCVPVVNPSLSQSAVGTYSVLANNFATLGSSYFIRVFFSNRNDLYNDSAIFNVTTDSLCTGITCANGGSCSRGSCTCKAGWGGTYCTANSNSCAYTANYCVYGTCDTTSNQCVCSTGWTGTQCNYPVGCNLRCQNQGYLNTSDGLLFDCTFCICPIGYGGKDCSQCEAACANGGTLKSCNDPTYSTQPCNCPQFWDGQTCLIPYISLSFKLNLGTNNLNANNVDAFQTLVYYQIRRALGNPSGSDWTIYSVDTSGNVEVHFYNNPNGLLLRQRLIAELADATSPLYTTTTTVSNNQPSNGPTSSTPSYPPDNGSSKKSWFLPVVIIIPIVGFILLVVIIALIVKSCGGGGGGSGGTNDVPMATRS